MMLERTIIPHRFLTALWLGLFLYWAFDNSSRYVISKLRSLESDPWPWHIYGLIVGIPLLVIVSRAIAALGAIKLTVYTGFLIISVYFMFDLLYQDGSLDMFCNLGLGQFMFCTESDWLGAIAAWLTYAAWIKVRLVTYICLSYLVVRRKEFVAGIASVTLIAFADITLGWLMFFPYDGNVEADPFWYVLSNEWPGLLRAIFVQVSILTAFALVGAALTRARWPQISIPKRPRRYRRYRPARRVASRSRAA